MARSYPVVEKGAARCGFYNVVAFPQAYSDATAILDFYEGVFGEREHIVVPKSEFRTPISDIIGRERFLSLDQIAEIAGIIGRRYYIERQRGMASNFRDK